MHLFYLVFVVNLVSCLYMTGVIWLVQCVNYPLAKFISAEDFTPYQNAHIKAITPVVAPFMIAELASSVALLNLVPYDCTHCALVNNLIIGFWVNVLIWVMTILFSVPLHQKLKFGWNPELHKKLIYSNWVRTLSWSGRAGLLIYLLLFMLEI
jgi:hypothetical protein